MRYMDLQEFLDGGFLQEVNRRFFHPLGLALSVVLEDGKVIRLGEIWDSRDDPEGFVFADDEIEPEKADNVTKEWMKHVPTRAKLFGGSITQPVERKGK